MAPGAGFEPYDIATVFSPSPSGHDSLQTHHVRPSIKWKRRRESNPIRTGSKPVVAIKPHRNCLVPRVGLEPTRPAAPDFESGAATNYATEAKLFSEMRNNNRFYFVCC